MITKEQKQEIISTFGKNPKDTGSTAVQIALLDARIRDLNEHFKVHKKDHHSKTGLIKLVNQRRKLINYFKKTAPDEYKSFIQRLGIKK